MMSPQPAKRNAVLYVDDVTKLGFRRLFQHRRFVNKTRICTLINQIQIAYDYVQEHTYMVLCLVMSTSSNKARAYYILPLQLSNKPLLSLPSRELHEMKIFNFFFPKIPFRSEDTE